MNGPVRGYKFGKFFLEDDAESRRLYNGDDDFSVLHEREFTTLQKLLEHGNAFVSKKDLYFHDDDVDNDVEKSIGRIRHSLFDNYREPKYIKTAEKGYVFIAEIERIDERSEPEPASQGPNEGDTLNGDPEYKETGTGDSGTGTRDGLTFLSGWIARDNFNRWLFDPRNRLTLSAAICFIVTLVSSILVSLYVEQYSLPVISGIQALIIFVAAVFPLRFLEGFGEKRDYEPFWNNLSEKEKKAIGCSTFNEWKKSGEIAENILEKYSEWWKGILLSWVALYVCFCFTGLPRFKLENLKNGLDDTTIFLIIILSLLGAFLNNVSSGAIFICFKILNSPTKLGENNRPKISDVLQRVTLVVVAFSVIEAACLLGFYYTPYFKGHEQIAEIMKFFSGISGIAAAAVMALYFGRLQSKLLNPPSWLINLLFIYTAIQPLFLFLDERTWGPVLMNGALFFKSMLFLYMTYLFLSGRLFFYLMRIRKNYENIEEEFDTFSRILNK